MCLDDVEDVNADIVGVDTCEQLVHAIHVDVIEDIFNGVFVVAVVPGFEVVEECG